MIRTYARIAAAALLAVALAGWAHLGWEPGEVLYHAGLALLFALVGSYPGGGRWVRSSVGGLGVLLVVVKGVEIVASWLAPMHILVGPIEISCLIVGISSILAAGYLPDDG